MPTSMHVTCKHCDIYFYTINMIDDKKNKKLLCL